MPNATPLIDTLVPNPARALRPLHMRGKLLVGACLPGSVNPPLAPSGGEAATKRS